MSTDASTAGSPWHGWVLFGGCMLIIVGCLNVIQGLVAFLKHSIFAIPSQGLLVVTDYDAWGWLLLLWGIVMVLAGIGLFTRSNLARWVAIVLVGINMLVQFMWFPALPLWSILVIALNAVVLYALSVAWDDAVHG